MGDRAMAGPNLNVQLDRAVRRNLRTIAGYATRRVGKYVYDKTQKYLNDKFSKKSMSKMTQPERYGGRTLRIKSTKGKKRKRTSFKKMAMKKFARIPPPCRTISENIQPIQATSAINCCGYTEADLWNSGTYGTLCSTLYVASSTGVRSAVSYASSASNTSVLIDCWGELKLRNNYTMPAYIDVYLCCYKNSPTTASFTAVYDAALTDEFASAPADTVPGLKPFTLPEVNRFVKVLNHTKQVLAPGDEFSSYAKYKLKYKPGEETLSRTEKKNDQFFLIRTIGPIAHQSDATSSINYAPTRVDGVLRKVFKMSYEGTGSMRTFIYTSTLPTLSVASVTEDTVDTETGT